MAVKASVALVDRTATSKTRTSDVVHLSFILANVSALVLHGLKMITEPRPWRLHIQMLIERVVMDTRFFAMLVVGGSLLGSVLCFLEKLPTWAGMNSIGKAKTKIGHALMMILQVGVMEKFKSIPLDNHNLNGPCNCSRY